MLISCNSREFDRIRSGRKRARHIVVEHECDNCDQVFDSERELRDHQSSDHPAVELSGSGINGRRADLVSPKRAHS